MLFKTKNPVQTVSLVAPDVYLRPSVLEDYAQWARVRERNKAFLEPYEPTWPQGCLTPSFFERRVKNLQAQWNDDRSYCFLIFLADRKTLIGGINLNNVCRGAAQYASLGYWLDERAQGAGYMTQAGRAILTYAFDGLNLSRVNAATLVNNDKSKSLLMRLGFAEEGFAKAYIQINGKRQDHILFGLNKGDFEKSGAAGHGG